MSLRLRLMISISLGLLASLACGGVMSVWGAAHQVDTEMRSVIALAERTAQAAVGESSRDPGRQKRLEQLIGQFDDHRHVQAMVVDRGGQVLLASRLARPSTHVPDWFRHLVDRGPEIARITLPPGPDDADVVVLKTDCASELAERWDDMVLALIVLLAFCTLVLGLVYWTLAAGLQPLQAINAAFERVGGGDYTPRVPEAGAAELAHLAREFNHMVTRLSTMQLQNIRLNEQLAGVQEEERAELARELHDEVGPLLFAVGLDIATIRQTICADGPASAELEARLEAVRTSITQIQKHIQAILGRLKPSVLLDLGLAQAMDNLMEFWRRRHPNVVFDVKVAPESLGQRLDEGIYRIAREGLSNALRHGRPSRVDITVQLAANNTVHVEILDDGGGMKLPNAAVGFGITGMQERAAQLGGTIAVQDRDDGRGVVVRAQLPCQGLPARASGHKDLALA